MQHSNEKFHISSSTEDFVESTEDFVESTEDFVEESAEDFVEESAEDFVDESAEDFVDESTKKFIEKPKKVLIKDLAEKLYWNTEGHVDLMRLAVSFVSQSLKKLIGDSLSEVDKKALMQDVQDVQKIMNILKTTAYIQKNIAPTGQEEVMNLALEQLENLS